MARKPLQKNTKKSAKQPAKRGVKKIVSQQTASVVPQILPDVMPSAHESMPKNKIGYVLVGIIAIAALIFFTNRGMFLAATINGKPIFRWTLTKMLTDRYGKQTLDSMITEMLIVDSANKSGIIISQSDVSQEENKIVKSFGGKVTIDELLKYQGMTKADFDSQIKLQLIVQKILSKDVKVDEKEVTDYIEENRETMTATDEAGLSKEASDALISQKISEKVQPWLTQLRSKASITTYIQ